MRRSHSSQPQSRRTKEIAAARLIQPAPRRGRKYGLGAIAQGRRDFTSPASPRGRYQTYGSACPGDWTRLPDFGIKPACGPSGALRQPNQADQMPDREISGRNQERSCFGVTPSMRLKCRVRWLWSAKPTAAAISASERSPAPAVNRERALLTRTCTRYW